MQFYAYIESSFNTLGLGIMSLKPADIVDIAIVALCIYIILLFIKRTRSFFLVNAVLTLLIISYLSQTLNLGLTRELLQPLFTFFFIIIVIVYQKEIRSLVDWFSLAGRNLTFLRQITTSSEISTVLVRALMQMAEDRTGAIIVLEGEYPLDDIVKGGFPLEGKVSLPLLLSIFDDNTPGHDGAVLIKDHIITSFGLHLPLAEHYDKFADFGTRHRAATGITENTDAIALVVSEEKGIVSYAQDGKLTKIKDKEELEELIRVFLKENIEEQKNPYLKTIFVDNFLMKLLAIVIALSLWFIFIYQTGFTTHEYTVPVEFRYIPDGEVVSSIVPSDVTLDLVGRTSDFNSLDPKKIRIVVDVSDTGGLYQEVQITKSIVQYPNYFTISRIYPSEVNIALKKESASSSSTVK